MDIEDLQANSRGARIVPKPAETIHRGSIFIVRWEARMRLFPLILTLAPMALAQLPAPNDAGVAMGHLHLNVKDIEVSKKFWVDQLGANVVKLGQMDAMKFPGTIVLLRKADPTGGTEGSSVNHIGFLVRDLDKELANWQANSVHVVSENPKNRQVFLM